MSTTTTAIEQRLVFAPDGYAWVDGYSRWTGGWQHEGDAADETDQSKVRQAVPDGDTGWSVVSVPAHEPASQADLMRVAALVTKLEQRNERWEFALQMVAGALNFYLDPTPLPDLTSEREERDG